MSGEVGLQPGRRWIRRRDARAWHALQRGGYAGVGPRRVMSHDIISDEYRRARRQHLTARGQRRRIAIFVRRRSACMPMMVTRRDGLVVNARGLARVCTMLGTGGICPSRRQVNQGACENHRDETTWYHVDH